MVRVLALILFAVIVAATGAGFGIDIFAIIDSVLLIVLVLLLFGGTVLLLLLLVTVFVNLLLLFFLSVDTVTVFGWSVHITVHAPSLSSNVFFSFK